MNRSIYISVGAALLVLLTGSCSKNGLPVQSSRLIRFSTVSNGRPSTKTSYGADYTHKNGKKYQALDWEDGDLVTIASPQATVQNGSGHMADYKVTRTRKGDQDDVRSTGSVTNAFENGLMWEEEGDYQFYAVYPSATSDAISLDPLTGDVEATIPRSQNPTLDMTKAFMTADTLVNSSAQYVPLTFRPAFTALEFHVSTQGAEVDLDWFKLVAKGNDHVAGSFTMKAGAALSSVQKKGQTADDQTILVDFADGTKISKDQEITFTVFTIPVDNQEAYTIKFRETGIGTCFREMTYSASATEHTPNAPVVFEAGHKYRINALKLPDSRWKFTIDLENEVLDWVGGTEDPIESDYSDNVQASPFVVTGGKSVDNNNSVATWEAGKPIFVTFSIENPQNAKWFVAPYTGTAHNAGQEVQTTDVTAFKVTVVEFDDSGRIVSESEDLNGIVSGTTTVNLKIEPRTLPYHGGEQILILSTSVAFGGKEFSMDSETQMIDVWGDNGYWKFIIPAND